MVAEYASVFEELSKHIRATNADYQNRIEILGPAVAPIGKMRGKHRWQMVVKGEKQDLLHAYVSQILEQIPSNLKRKGVRLGVDVDPVNI